MAEKDEKEPLLATDHNFGSSGSQYGRLPAAAPVGSIATASSVGPDELPPSYLTAVQGGGTMVTCRVCQTLIDISGKRDQHVVKCSQCNEATAIKSAPPGKKYIRCPCNCLLICKATSQRIACPRPNCKKIISLAPAAEPQPSVPGMCRATCGHCHDTFLFNTLSNALARCPHCRKVSSVGPYFARNRGTIYMVSFAVFFIVAIGTVAGTWEKVDDYKGLYVAYVLLFVAALACLGRAIYYYCMKVSSIEGAV